MGDCKERITMQVSLVIAAIDDFTNQPISGNTLRIWIDGIRPPVLKSEGFYVFVDLEMQDVAVHLEGPLYHARTLELSKEQLEHYRGKSLKVRMLPNRSYPIPSDTTCIQGRIDPGCMLMAYNCDNEKPMKLLYPGNAGETNLCIYHPDGMDLEGRTFFIRTKEPTKQEIIRIMEQLDSQKGSYQLEQPLEYSYKKIGTVLEPIICFQADERGEFYLPISSVCKEKSKFLIWKKGYRENAVKVELINGKVNTVTME